ncbi:MAG: hypothetical protein MUE90_06755 [Thermoanaerobaculales bacterium]|jgi:hypothetical protein|nr:hypothetical protein [Thermoanaerobaculales bacterium]
MLRPFRVAAALAAALLGGAGLAGAAGMDLLEALGAALRGAAAWQADYTQEYVAAGMTAGEEVAGVVTVAWPDRALFAGGVPPSQLMGLEGRVVRLLDLEVPSCDEHVLGDDEWARVPLAAVLDPRGAVERFTVLDHGERGFALVPREPGGVARVEVSLDGRDLPAEVVVVDPQGAVNRLRFGGWRAAAGPPDGRWLPEPPRGLDCVRD